MFRQFQVRQHERALLLKNGRCVAVLEPGTHRLLDPLRQLEAVVVAARDPLDERLARALDHASPALVEGEFNLVRLGANEVGLRYEAGAPVELLAPDTRRYYFKAHDVRVKRLDIARRFALPYSLTLQFGTAAGRGAIAGAQDVLVVQVPPHHAALLRVDGHVHSVLRPGQHAFFRFGRALQAELVDLRRLALDVAAREMREREKMVLRTRREAGVPLIDELAARAQQAQAFDQMQRDLQCAVRAAIGAGTAPVN